MLINAQIPNTAKAFSQIAEAPKDASNQDNKEFVEERPAPKPSWLKLLVENEQFQELPKYGVIAAVLGNAVSTFVNFFETGSSSKKFGDFLAKLGTKAFLFLNGNVNGLEWFQKKNYLLSFSYFMENAVMAFVPQHLIFLLRGFVSGGYTLGNALSLINKQDSFENLEEFAVHIVKGLKKTWNNIISDPVNNFLSPKTGLMSMIAGVLKIMGPSGWAITRSEKIGAGFRDFGNLMQNLEQIKPGHMLNRFNYFLAGIGMTLGTLSDYFSKWAPDKKSILVPFSLMTDLLGVYFLRRAQSSGELKE